MKEINYPLIVSDFDGTLVQTNHEIGEESKKVIQEYINDGGVFAISTGRMPAGILPRVKELGLKGIVSCCQGSIIMEIESGKRLLDDRIPAEITLQIVKKMEELGLHIHIYDEWEYYSNIDDEPLHWYENATRQKAKIVDDRPLSSFIKENNFATYKVLSMIKVEDAERIMAELEACNFVGCTVTRSAEYLVEVINAKNSKGTAVEFLAKYYNIPMDKVICIGDQWNDVPMIKTAGLGIAVKNADQILKQEASFVCEYTNNENAVGKIIQQFGYKENI